MDFSRFFLLPIDAARRVTSIYALFCLVVKNNWVKMVLFIIFLKLSRFLDKKKKIFLVTLFFGHLGQGGTLCGNVIIHRHFSKSVRGEKEDRNSCKY